MAKSITSATLTATVKSISFLRVGRWCRQVLGYDARERRPDLDELVVSCGSSPIVGLLPILPEPLPLLVWESGRSVTSRLDYGQACDRFQ